MNKDVRILVTGGAGFIGSHLVDALIKRGEVVKVLDNLSSGLQENVAHLIGHPNFEFIVGDCLNPKDLRKAMTGCELVFHLAANPEVRLGVVNTKIDFEQNIVATYNVLEEMRKNETANTLAFTSSSTVYGDAELLPTSEDYGPLKPISIYGASKLACEALISAYCNTFNIHGVIYRFANIVGPRSTHGVILDFIRKLTRNPEELEILGDGTQTKSYLLVDECIDAILLALENAKDRVEIYNVGSVDRLNVADIAKVVINESGLKEVKLRYTGGVEGGRGWKGDVKVMFLDISKLKRLGWRPRHTSIESVRIAAKQILDEVRDSVYKN